MLSKNDSFILMAGFPITRFNVTLVAEIEFKLIDL